MDVGELHDFSRFGQAVVTRYPQDSERYNHAKLGARLLFTHRMIDDIILNYEDICEADRIVMEKAVYHHSDYVLPNDLTDRERLFCGIISEADKIDIFRTCAQGLCESTCGYSRDEILKSDISPEVESAFYRHETVNNSEQVYPADYYLRNLSLCFGLESEAARHRVVEQGYVMKLIDREFMRAEVQARYLKMKEQVNNFLGI